VWTVEEGRGNIRVLTKNYRGNAFRKQGAKVSSRMEAFGGKMSKETTEGKVFPGSNKEK